MEGLAERFWVAATVLKTVGHREVMLGFESLVFRQLVNREV